MKPTMWDPFQDLVDLHNNLLGSQFTASSLQLPTTDVYEKDGNLVVEVSLPTFAEKDIEIHLTEAGLEIKAEHSEEKKEEDKKRKYYVRETSSGTFYRVIALPRNADKEAAEAHFEDGILYVTVPMKEKAAPKKLAVKESTSKKKLKK